MVPWASGPGVGAPQLLPPLVSSEPFLVVTDVDSTLIEQEVIEELAAYAGTRTQVAEITSRAMNGELDFAQSLHARVATLKGLPSSVFAEVVQQIRFTAGAKQLVEAVHARGGTFGVVSGGFGEIVEPLCQQLGIDHWVANRLEVKGGVLTGRVLGDVVTAQTKVECLRRWASADGVGMSQTIAVGDGANDVPMLAEAAVGFAFCAKPAVREQVPLHINIARLDAVCAVWC
ncbi:phosphoserine phosphatase SerB [Schaalia suimastitidis]|uniref:phosphoserine phosphatase SerB n=1 Tax=Schaalia suimastitidis TaxID=121163 RepID=UPI00047D9D65